MIIQGRNIEQENIQEIENLMAAHPDWHRTQISRELCQLWDWTNGNGHIKDMAARTLLLKLEQRGCIQLPPRRTVTCNASRKQGIKPVLHDQTPVEGKLSELLPLRLELVESGRGERHELFRCLLANYHYLGYSGPVGENLKYFVLDREDRVLACLLFGSAAWKCQDRDIYIGWDAATRQKRLPLVTNNMRFLILPWVKVPHLASHILSRIARRLSQDFLNRYGHKILLLETFVDSERFPGTCYRAAGWVKVGETKGRSRNDRENNIRVPCKAVFVYPLERRFREVLGQRDIEPQTR